MPIWRRRGKSGAIPAGSPPTAAPPTMNPATMNPPTAAPRPAVAGTLTPARLVDICVVFDTTGSMSGKIKGLINSMTDFVDQLGRVALDWRISVLPFGDLTIRGDRVVTSLPFVNTAERAKKQLREMPRFSGGGNVGESSIEAVLGAASKPWRDGAVRIVILLTDEPALKPERSEEVLATLLSSEIITFVASPDHEYYKDWAERTEGEWFRIGKSMDTGALMDLLHRLVGDVAAVAAEVIEKAGGNYGEYLRLAAESKAAEGSLVEEA
jgi:von Willebrand factor type A domain